MPATRRQPTVSSRPDGSVATTASRGFTRYAFGLAGLSGRTQLSDELANLYAVAPELSNSKPLAQNPALLDNRGSDIFCLRWRGFTESLQAQWQLVNYVSAVFVGTLSTLMQDPAMSGNILGRTFAIASFLCALASLCFGLILPMHLSGIKSTDHAIRWISHAKRMSSNTWRNPVHALLTPSVWLLWSAIFLVSTILTCFVWHPTEIKTHLPLRLTVVCILVLWASQAILVAWTLGELKATSGSKPSAEIPVGPGDDIEMQSSHEIGLERPS